MNDQFDRTLLRSLIALMPGNQYTADSPLLKANAEQLWGALACLDEKEFRELEQLNLDRKIRVILQKKEVEEQRRRYWGPLVVGILSLILGAVLGFHRSCTH
jgi:hypothetical protein